MPTNEQKHTNKADFQVCQNWYHMYTKIVSTQQGHKGKRKKVAVQVNWQHGGLGVSLRGGKEYGIGLYIAR